MNSGKARRRGSIDIGRVIRWLPAAQIALAALLMGGDLLRIAPDILAGGAVRRGSTARSARRRAATLRPLTMAGRAGTPRLRGRRGANVVAEPLGEDPPHTSVIPASEPPHREVDPDAPTMSGEVRKGTHVAAVDPPRRLAAVRADRPDLPRARNRRNPAVIYPHLLDDQPRRQQCRRQSAPPHPLLLSLRNRNLPPTPGRLHRK
jgi:hypothetical protein